MTDKKLIHHTDSKFMLVQCIQIRVVQLRLSQQIQQYIQVQSITIFQLNKIEENGLKLSELHVILFHNQHLRHIIQVKFHLDRTYKLMKRFLNWVANDAETALHPCGTAKMGDKSDPMAVVDPNTMKVHGLDNLHVVDASAMPYVTNGNIHAPVLMLAEKAADLIIGREPLEPLELDYYVHDKSKSEIV